MPKNNILMLFAPQFYQFGVDVGKEYVRRKGQGLIHGLCTGPASLFNSIKDQLGEHAGSLWHLHSEESRWLSESNSINNLSLMDNELGPGAFGRIIVADRRVGRGFVRGGICRPDAIGKRCANSAAYLPQQYASGLYGFLDKILSEIKPDSVFCYAVAGAPALALAEMCKARGISFSTLTTVRIGNRYAVDGDYRGRLTSIARCYDLARNGGGDLSYELLQAREMQERFLSSPESPGYMQRNYGLISSTKLTSTLLRAVGSTVLQLVKLVKSPSHFHHYQEVMERKWFEVWAIWRRIFVRKKYFTTHIPETKRFIFYPLHVDPEASTMVLSPWHTDQVSVIEALAKSAPADMAIVVKEHIPMLGKRPPGFYKAISRIPRVVLLAPEQSSFRLIQQAALVAVITGTAAWEAIRLKKPALVIGDFPFLAIGEGVIHEPSLEKLPEAIKDAMAMSSATDSALEYYIAACLHESFELNSSLMWGDFSAHPQDERKLAIENIVNGILRLQTQN